MSPRTPTTALLAVLLLAGCAVKPREFPRTRMGGLPFPGVGTFYKPADYENLGEHRYAVDRRFVRTGEAERGIIYTSRAGFLDLAHVRMGIDWTRFCTLRVAEAIEARETRTQMIGANGSVVHVRFNYPDDWDAMDPLARASLSRELSLRVGQRLAYLITTWHELATWFGARQVSVVDESGSSFNYDDSMAHVVGLGVAADAMESDLPFDQAVTVALDRSMHRLGAVGPDQTQAAVRAVEGSWWDSGVTRKRQLDVGIVTGYVQPWLVPGLDFAPAPAEPELFWLPSLASVDGRDFRGFYTAAVEPRLERADEIRDLLPGRPILLAEYNDIPLLIEAVRIQMKQRLAPDADLPYPIAGRPSPADTTATRTAARPN